MPHVTFCVKTSLILRPRIAELSVPDGLPELIEIALELDKDFISDVLSK